MRLIKKCNRRSFLTGLAGGAALAPLIPRLESHAGGNPIPKRLFVFFNSHGLAYENWKPTGGVDNFQLSPVLSPLEPHRDRLVILDGLANEAVMAGPGKDHLRSVSTLLTGTEMSSDTNTGGPSVDQIIADALEAPNNVYRSLHSAVNSSPRNLSSRGSNDEIAAQTSPAEQFNRVFSEFTLDDSEVLELRQNRQSVIDIVRGQLQSVRSSVPVDDRYKLDAHLDGVAAIEERLATLGDTPQGCSIPQAPGNGGTVQAQGRAHMDILVNALACDITRVAVLGYPGGQYVPDWLPGVGDVYHDICHQGSRPDRPLYQELTDLSTWFAGEFKYLLDRLAASQEIDGSSLLDHTLVLWCTNMSDGGHRWDSMPMVLAGGNGTTFDTDFGSLQTGRSLVYDGRTLNDLCSSLCGLMGADDGPFGNPAYANGPLPSFV
jgi:hypothetical protein